MSVKLSFTKMHGAGNDFVVVDATRVPVMLTRDQWRWVADRHFGVGADQILVVQPPDAPDVDFVYRIFNADGAEVEQCGNGARCFVKFVRDRGLTDRDRIRVRTRGGIIEPHVAADGRITVDMGRPVFDLARLPFDSIGLPSRTEGDATLWGFCPSEGAREPLPPPIDDPEGRPPGLQARVYARLAPRADVRWIEVVSMGNPHAVQIVPSVEQAPVATEGPAIEAHVRFPQRVNAGFMEITSRSEVRLRVYERGAGETLACGSGACAAVVSGIHRGRLDSNVHVHTRGGRLTIRWDGNEAPVLMTGPAETVFESEITVPDEPNREQTTR